MPQPDRGFELKLGIARQELDLLARNPKLNGDAPQLLHSVYYDTPSHRLRACGLSLRVREDGDGYIQTVKLGADSASGVSNPQEREDRLDGAAPDLSRIHDKRIRRRAEAAVKDSALAPVFETVVTRTTHRLRRRGSIVDLVLDKGEAVVKGRKNEICEAGLGLVKGDPEDLLKTAQSLFAGRGVRFSPLHESERAYQLLQKKRPARKPAPEKARPADIAKSQTSGEAFAEVFRSARRQIAVNREVVLKSEDPEGAHQLRVGLTRLRSAHRSLKALMNSPQLRQLEKDAQTIARAVGQLRDADVLIADLYAPVANSLPDAPGFKELGELLQAHRGAKQKQARQALTGEAWLRLALSLTLWPAMLEAEPCLQGPVKRYADRALQQRWKKAAKLGRQIASLEGENRHRMRKSLKKLRYSVEFFAPLYRKANVKPFVKQLKSLQDVFGYVNDVAMAAQLRDLCGSDKPEVLTAAGEVLGYHEAKAHECWQEAPEAWHRLKASGRFWK